MSNEPRSTWFVACDILGVIIVLMVIAFLAFLGYHAWLDWHALGG